MVKSQSARLPGHVEEQSSSMDKFIAWKSSSDTTAGWANHSHSQNGSKSFWSKEFWPPSPDLNPMDFEIWSILERKACAISHSNVKKLKKSKESWAKIESETIRAKYDQVIYRLCRVIIEKGGYIE